MNTHRVKDQDHRSSAVRVSPSLCLYTTDAQDNHTLHLHSTDAPLHWVVHFSREKKFSSLTSMQLSFNSFQNAKCKKKKKSFLQLQVCRNVCKGSAVQRKDMTRSSLILNMSRKPGSDRYMVTERLFTSIQHYKVMMFWNEFE